MSVHLGEKPLVSIVAVSFNHEPFVIQTLNSIRNQSYSNIQLIIVDDYSQDNTVARIRQWIEHNNVKCDFLRHDKNCGVCSTLNEAFELVKGEFYQMIACDDVMEVDKIEKQVSIFLNHKEISTVHSSAMRIDENNNLLDPQFILGENQVGFQDSQKLIYGMIRSSSIIAPTLLYRVSHLPPLPLYNESYMFEDLYLNLRLLCEDRKFFFLDEPLAKYRVLDSSLVRNEEYKVRLKKDRKEILKELLLGKDADTDRKVFAYLNSQIGLRKAFANLLSGDMNLTQFRMKVESKLRS